MRLCSHVVRAELIGDWFNGLWKPGDTVVAHGTATTGIEDIFGAFLLAFKMLLDLDTEWEPEIRRRLFPVASRTRGSSISCMESKSSESASRSTVIRVAARFGGDPVGPRAFACLSWLGEDD